MGNILDILHQLKRRLAQAGTRKERGIIRYTTGIIDRGRHQIVTRIEFVTSKMVAKQL